MNDAELGKKYKDKITGFKGVCTGKCQYISGCDQALLVPKVAKDGTKREAQWFDVQRLDAWGSAVAITLDNTETPGPDMPAPIK
jgi:hypothetical protein